MKTALLVIDVQVGIIDYPAYDTVRILTNINGLLNSARAAKIPVIYVRHGGEKGDPLETNTAGWQIDQRIAPIAGEPIVDKRSCSSFYETPLQSILSESGISRLIVTGCQTEFCIDTACRHATTLGYDVTLVGDGHTTIDNDLLKAAQIIAHHNQLLNGFNSGRNSVAVKPANQIVFSLEL